MAVAKLFVEIAADASDFATKLGGVESQINSVASKWKSIGSGISDAGKTLTGALTLPIVAAGTAATVAAIQWEEAFAGVLKTVDGTAEELQYINDGLREMSRVKPLSNAVLANIAELGGQLGISPENLLGFTAVVADLTVSTNLTAEDAALQLAQFANITKMSQDDFDRLGAVVVDLGNNMATTEADIVAMALRLAGAGQTVGMTQGEILGLAAALSSVGIDAEAGGSAMSRVMINMANAVADGGDSLDDFAAIAGMSGPAFADAFGRDPAGAIVTFIGGLSTLQDAGENVFAVLDDLGLSEIRVRDALLRASNAGELFAGSLDLGRDAWKDNTALAEEAAKRYETTASKLTMLKNRFVDMLVEVGGPLVDALTAALKAAEPLFRAIEAGAKAFANMPPGMQQTIIKVLALVAALGPTLIIIGKVVTAVGTIIGAFGGVSGAVSGIVGAFGWVAKAIGVVLGVLSLKVLLIVGAIVGALYLLYQAWTNNWGGIQEKTAAVWEWIKTAFGNVVAWLTTNIPTALAAVAGFWESTLLPAFQQVATWVTTVLVPAFQTVVSWLGERMSGAVSGAASIWETTLLPALQAVWSWLQENLFPVLKALVDVYIAVMKLEIAALAYVWTNLLLPALRAVWMFFKDSLGKVFEWFATDILPEITSAVADAGLVWETVLLPALRVVWAFIKEQLGVAFQWLSDTVLPGLEGALSGITGWLQGMADKLTILRDRLLGLSLPSWLTPGSPTPFERALWGIAEALGVVDGKMHDMTRGAMPGMPLGLGEDGAAGAAGNRYHIEITINGNGDHDTVRGGVLAGLRAAGVTP